MSVGMPRFAATATAGALALALTLGSVAPAGAQLGSIDPTTLGPDDLETIIEAVGSVPLGSTAGSLGSVGSADIPLGEGSSAPIGTPSPVDPSITETEFRGVERTRGEYQYWIVASESMQREITVEVVPSRGEGAAPVLYMLDGVGAPVSSTGWNHQGQIADRLADEDVHVVNPAGAFASYYTDWEQPDPVLGNNKWETFLTEELPGVVAEQLETSGRNGIGGISMGGQAAMHLAATHPGLYDAVMSFSGYYSTMDALGYQTVRLSVETRGGQVDNMWGPHRSGRWAENDTISHPEGLRGKAVYFSSGSGEIGPEDLQEYGGGADVQNLLIGLVLEKGVREGTEAFERALDRANVDHRVDYSDTGLHNWPNFLKNFEAGWEHIKPALED
ncbi:MULTISPECIES: alpha/beta hydrolase family protein [unclassified Dietzia]|uniref:alpha/beta hydrolase n=2 Tax=unclassified Dietzia TaxID=2617939 RepID=UPI0015F97764|nr:MULTISPECIES: alpha/beta hydrolase family protein [unclassified Dietzia]MBB1041179.1 esterase family protein [Dietzia sp. Cai40]MBB1044493.1 esterase family protein [Dietzia sp. DQ11-44]MBB1054046.1 esterase family protein [Dietzia sp. B44]